MKNLTFVCQVIPCVLQLYVATRVVVCDIYYCIFLSTECWRSQVRRQLLSVV